MSQNDIERLLDQEKENMAKANEARSPTEERHYRMLASKNAEAIKMYKEQSN